LKLRLQDVFVVDAAALVVGLCWPRHRLGILLSSVAVRHLRLEEAALRQRRDRPP
jgi:hypothetical protein